MARSSKKPTKPRTKAASTQPEPSGPRVRCRRHGSKDELHGRRHDGPEPIGVRCADAERRADPGDWIVSDEREDLDVLKPGEFGKSYHVLPTTEDPPSEAGR